MSLEMYRAQILEHYKNPKNKGTLAQANARFKDSNPLCADEIEVFLQIEEGKIQDIRFDGEGCAISMAAASLLTEAVKGKTLEDVKALTRENVFALLGVPLSPARVKCALLSLKVIKSAAYAYLGEKLTEKVE